jgi:hypothetical protein
VKWEEKKVESCYKRRWKSEKPREGKPATDRGVDEWY